MDAKTIRGLVGLAALSLFCATVASAVDHAAFTSVFAALGAVAILGAAAPKPRSPGADGRQLCKTRGLCVMPHFARIVISAFALVAASCSAERAQQELERRGIGQQLAAAYDSCVRTSFASMLPTMIDLNSGIDQAFMVCRTEESKLRAI